MKKLTVNAVPGSSSSQFLKVSLGAGSYAALETHEMFSRKERARGNRPRCYSLPLKANTFLARYALAQYAKKYVHLLQKSL